MFLKTLTIKGFKSFAEKAQLHFEPGVTVIVGPNGSGKSNVVDAVAWVLGAQGPSTVRSGKMDDVIFAGTAERPALGRAEVSLTIDNSSGLLPIEFSEVEITRTLFRSGDSEYAVNGVPCRLLDIQDLLSDSGVGRQQHVIISQGQVDAVLNARPEARRAVVEEAAGVLKFRKRKEKAERRLESTEGSLLRLQDTLREVKRQLRPLERQADAARRHGAVEAELRAIRLHLLGRQIRRLRDQLSKSGDERRQHSGRERAIRDRLAELDASVTAVEATLGGTADEGLDDAMVRVEALRERSRGLAALAAEKRAGLERARRAAADESVVASLRAEEASVRAQLDELDRSAASLEPLLVELREAEAREAEARAHYEELASIGAADREAEAAEARGELRALTRSIEQRREELERLTAAIDAATERRLELEAELGQLRSTDADEVAARPDLESALAEAREAKARREDELSAAEDRRRQADADAHRWRARAEALTQALDEARSAAGADRLEGLDGIFGPLAEHLEIEEGAEAAVAAALGEAMAALVVRDADAARSAIEQLAQGDAHALLVVLEGADRAVQGRLAPPGARPLVELVSSPTPGLDAVLEALLDGVVLVDAGWREALALALEYPTLTVTTPAGERFGVGDTWRAGAGIADGATRAALEEALARAESAEEAQRVAERTLIDARRRYDEVHVEERRLAGELDGLTTRQAAVGEAISRVERDLRRLDPDLKALVAEREEQVEGLLGEEARLAELEGLVPQLQEVETAAEERRRRTTEAKSLLEQRASEADTRRAQVERHRAAADERRSLLEARLAEVEARLAGHATDGDDRREAADLVARAESLARVERALTGHATRVAELHDRLDRARQARSAERRQAHARLDGLRRERSTLERELEGLRERLQRIEIDDAEARMRLDTAVETCRNEFDCEPEAAMEAESPELPEGTSRSERARELERELRLMGPINPLALEEFEALQERHAFLEEQLDDVRRSRRELHKVIRAVDDEIATVFGQAYADVERHFGELFARLFPGGQGAIRLTDPADLLNAGIEIEAKPSGKNVKRLSLLSGGERSLVAMAFLFAVFRARPSPFYLLDEVEAALDDVNLHRFLELVDEFRGEAQLVIVSHQKRTMEAADVLYGVSMPPGGSSRAVAEKLSGRDEPAALTQPELSAN